MSIVVGITWTSVIGAVDIDAVTLCGKLSVAERSILVKNARGSSVSSCEIVEMYFTGLPIPRPPRWGPGGQGR